MTIKTEIKYAKLEELVLEPMKPRLDRNNMGSDDLAKNYHLN